jgi:hypothetical protein
VFLYGQFAADVFVITSSLHFFCSELQFYLKTVGGNVILPLNSRFCANEEFRISGHCFMHFVEIHSQKWPLTFYVHVIRPMRNTLDIIAYEAFNSYTSGDQDIQIYGFL